MNPGLRAIQEYRQPDMPAFDGLYQGPVRPLAHCAAVRTVGPAAVENLRQRIPRDLRRSTHANRYR